MIFSGKHIVYTLVLIFVSCISYAENCVDQISRQFSKGNADAISGYFDANVSLSLPGSQATYSHAQAAMILNDFFEKNHSKKATIERSGTNGGNQFAIGKLVTAKTEYRLYMVVKETADGACMIKELRLEK